MAKNKKGQIEELLLAPRRASPKGRFYGPFGAIAPGSSPVTVPAEMPVELPELLPGPRIPASARAGRRPAAFPPMPGKRRASGQRREPGAFLRESGASVRDSGSRLGPPLSIGQVAALVGCSPWTVRQTLIPRGLPHFRFTASGRLTFFEGQVVAWIENQQRGKTK
jgi:hypothetical protein